MKTTCLPVSAIVPTLDRTEALRKMLFSLGQQSCQPREMIIVDASTSEDTNQLCQNVVPELRTTIIYARAQKTGAAAQRNQGVAMATQPFICFFDDDVLFEALCLERLWRAIESDEELGGVSAMITNQRYQAPGLISRILFTFMAGQREASFAGRVIGPAMNLLPEDRDDLPEVVPVDWLNLGCTIYRREALPSPAFDPVYTGYSLMEDLTLSLRVGRKWVLGNARTAKIFHDSQPAEYKANKSALAKMELVNRHYVMTRIMGRGGFGNYAKLAAWELFGILTPLASLKNWASLLSTLVGKSQGAATILSRKNGKK